MTLTPKQRAIAKTKLEIKKDISRLVEMAQRCGLGEMQFFLHYLHFSRLLKRFGDVPDEKQEMIGVYARRIDDAYKYIIQLLAKHCKDGFIRNNIDNTLIKAELVQVMTKHALEINSKFETISFLTMFRNLEVYGERDQHVKVNLEDVTKDEYLSKYLYYGVRADREHDFLREPELKDDFLNHFRKEYEPYADLFLKEFQITIEEFIELINWIIETITTQIKADEQNYVRLQDGKVDIKAYKTILLFGYALFLKKEKVTDRFGESVNKILSRLIFKPNDYDENELRFNIIERQPIVEKKNYYIISPEILLDSFFVNSHYSLLEAGDIKEEYKKRFAKVFVDKISNAAKQAGFEEFDRDLELYEGKNQIGDIDIILKNEKNEFLLVEAKNHSIPLDVYFHDFEATEKRLDYLQHEWEKKVNRRQKHLEIHHAKYGIASTFKYIIVSKSPEIISHFSNNLYLSLAEFEYWVKAKNLAMQFEEVFEQVYKLNDSTLTEKQLISMQQDLLRNWQFSKD